MKFLSKFLGPRNQTVNVTARNAYSSGATEDSSDEEEYDTIVAPITSHMDSRRSTGRRAGLDMCFSTASRSIDLPGRTLRCSRDLQLQYSGLKVLHRGRTATIFNARSRIDGWPVVIKAYSKQGGTPSIREKMEKEISLLTSISKLSGIVHLDHVVEDPDYKYLILEACSGGTLMEYIADEGGQLSEEETCSFVTKPVLHTLSLLHSRGVTHRDLRPEHFVRQGGVLKILDFTHAAVMDRDFLNHREGSLEYMAPEVLQKPSAPEVFHQVVHQGMSEDELPQYNEKVDVWSLGVIVYECVTGCQPFLGDSAAEVLEVQQQKLAIKKGRQYPDFITAMKVSTECKAFLTSALQMDPDTRPSAQQLLQHSWFRTHLSKDLSMVQPPQIYLRSRTSDCTHVSDMEEEEEKASRVQKSSWERRRMSSVAESLPSTRQSISGGQLLASVAG